jgi:hypothetical protein
MTTVTVYVTVWRGDTPCRMQPMTTVTVAVWISQRHQTVTYTVAYQDVTYTVAYQSPRPSFDADLEVRTAPAPSCPRVSVSLSLQTY